MTMKILNGLLLSLFALLASCAENDFANMYRSVDPSSKYWTDAHEIEKKPHRKPVSLKTVYGEKKITKERDKLISKGYLFLGQSCFTGPKNFTDYRDKPACNFARSIGANLVLKKGKPEFVETRNINFPVTTTRPVTSYHSGTVKSNQSYSSASYKGTTTTYETVTREMPLSLEILDFTTFFFYVPEGEKPYDGELKKF